MRQFHFYDASGLLHSNSIVVNAPDHEAVAQKNCPAGHKVVEGVFDPLCQRIDDAAHLRWKALRDELVQLSLEDQLPRLAELGSLRAQVAVDHQPAQPSADHEWNPHTKRWHQTGAAAAREAARTGAIARIAELEASQHRFVRELLALGDLSALLKLRAIYAEIATLQHLFVGEHTAFGLAPLPKLDDNATLSALMEFAQLRLEASRPQLLLPPAADEIAKLSAGVTQ